MSATFDFIIVGGGTAGCLLAHRLSHASAQPSVLLVEAGSKPEGEYLRAQSHRYSPVALRPDLDHGFTSTPQKELNQRSIVYTRGKGLGGSSILNFAVYLYGSAEDYDRWAGLVGDDSWAWEHARQSFQAIENYDFEAASQFPHLANPDPKLHGKNGSVKVCLPPALEDDIVPTMEALIKHGEKVNLDMNSGDPMGIGLFPSSYSKDGRTTSATAHLVDPPSNLTIWTGSPVHRLTFDGTKVVGIETAHGRNASSSKEVVLCGGAIDTPKILLLNGIGPAAELERLGIDVVKDLAGVGKALHDHVMTFLCAEVDSKHNNRYAFESNEKGMKEAEELWKRNQTGDLALYHSCLWGGFLKLPGFENWPEYKALDQGLQDFLARERTPTYEFIGNCLQWPPGTKLPEGSSYITTIAFVMNPQSQGSVTLASQNPDDKPIIELGYLEHPYDRRVLREAIRETWTKVYDNPEVKKHFKSRLCGPEDLSDEKIEAFMKDATTTVWHANGSVVMGKKDDPRGCVDSDLRVYGVEGLRVADVSVCPLTTNNHTQATAYLVGQKAAEKLITEYGLDSGSAAKL
ncbi:GMC oxidoreductase [Lophiostoma macrostomum CBS 122681]|uniref:GMC oxidoreductase n=1 Tax=Lophiostoma macrostomum CBS 122681 TaxID=1314788 RepID=A0A6A6SVG7_9PLEO|nr:GMC oxidoreductase [Lophiostoma macrostomum CBS 122681]